MMKVSVVSMLAVLAILGSGCAIGGGRIARTMEPPVRQIDVASLTANLPDGHGLLFEYGYRSVRPKGDVNIGNDMTLTPASALALIEGGARIGRDIGVYQVTSELVGKDRDLATTIIIAPGQDIAAMRHSDNAARLVQSGRDLSLFERLRLLPDPVVPTPDPDVPAPVTDPESPAIADNHIVRRISTWYGGEHLSGAAVDDRFALTVSPDGQTWSAAPSDWPMKDDLQVMCCAAYQNAAGEWVGGKFEWNRREPSSRSWNNIKDGYNGWIAPPAGTTMTVWCASVDGKRVSLPATAIFD